MARTFIVNSLRSEYNNILNKLTSDRISKRIIENNGVTLPMSRRGSRSCNWREE